RQLGLIVGGAARRAAARKRRVAEMAAAAGVHRRDELDARRESDMGVGARDADFARLQRLAQRIEHAALEFGKLVEEEDAEMREADLARAHAQPAADERGHRRRMMGRAEWTRADEAPALERSRDRCD